MKKINFKWLLLSFILSIASINTAWAIPQIRGFMNSWNCTDMTQIGTTGVYYYKATSNGEFKITAACDWNTQYTTIKTAPSNNVSLSGGNGSNISCSQTGTWYIVLDSDTKVYATTKDPSKFTVTYNANGGTGTTSSQSVTYNTSVATRANGFTRSGWEFDGWNTNQYAEGTSYAAGASITVTSDVTLYAKWKKVVYMKSSLSWWYNASAWFAVWCANADESKQAWVEMSQADNCSSPVVYKATIPGNGYTKLCFVRKDPNNKTLATWDNKWNQSNKESLPTTNNQFTITTGSDNCTGSWGTYSAPTFTISYAKGSPSASISGSRSNESKTCDVAFTLPSSAVFTRTGYSQTGWTTSDGGSKTHNLGGSYTTNSAQTFYPVWTPVNYSITYNLNGGTQQVSPAPATSYTIESSAITLPTPSKDGYDFDGWYDNDGLTGDAVTTIPAGSTGNKEYWAKWTEASTYYDVTFGVGTSYSSLGSLSAKVTSTSAAITSGDDLLSGTGVTFTASPNSYYQVKGWYTEAACSSAIGGAGKTNPYVVASLGSDLDVYVAFEPITYTITYYLDGGTNSGSNPATYNYETSTITLQDASKTGYTFGGWYTENTFVTKVTSISNHSNGNKVLYAKFTEIKSTVTVNANQTSMGTLMFGETSKSWGTTASVGVATTQSIKATANSGYVFDRWILSGGATTTSSLTSGTITLKGNGTGNDGIAKAVFGKTYYYRGDKNSNGATLMTRHESGYYAYYSTSGTHKFKCAATTDSWDYNTFDNSYGNIILRDANDGYGNVYCPELGSHYIMIFYPNTAVNSENYPVIAAGTTLFDPSKAILTLTSPSTSTTSLYCANNPMTIGVSATNLDGKTSLTYSYEYSEDKSSWSTITPTSSTSDGGTASCVWTTPNVPANKTYYVRAKLTYTYEAATVSVYSGASAAIKVTGTSVTTKTIKVKKPAEWDSFEGIHIWSSGDGDFNTSWPGFSIIVNHLGGSWYEFVIPSVCNNFVLNNGITEGSSNPDKYQTVDLTFSSSITDDNCYVLDNKTDASDGKYSPQKTYKYNLTHTDDCPETPTVSASAATNVTNVSATLNGRISDDGNDAITEYGFYWGTTSACANKQVKGTSFTPDNTYTHNLTGLTAGNTIYFKAFAKNGLGETVTTPATSFTVPYKVTITQPTGCSTITPGTGTQYVSVGDNIVATAATGYTFSSWSATNVTLGTPSTVTGVTTSAITAISADNGTIEPVYTANTYAVTFDATTNGGAITSGSSPQNVVFDETSVGSCPTAAKTGYCFDGWYTAASEGVKVIDAAGNLQPNVTVSAVQWTDGSSKWKKPSATTVYAVFVAPETLIEQPAKIAGKRVPIDTLDAKNHPEIDSVIVHQLFSCTPAANYNISYKLCYSNHVPLDVQPIIQYGTGAGVGYDTVWMPMKEIQMYELVAYLRTGSTRGEGTLVTTDTALVSVEKTWPVKVRYIMDGVDLRDATEWPVYPSVRTTEVRIPKENSGYELDHVDYGVGVTSDSAKYINEGATYATYVKAANAATIIAHYKVPANTIYVKRLDANGWYFTSFYVYEYGPDGYWTTGKGSGSNGVAAATQSEHVYRVDDVSMHGISGSKSKMSLTDYQMDNTENFETFSYDPGSGAYNATPHVIYRTDYNSALPMFVPVAKDYQDSYILNENGDKSKKALYFRGFWMRYSPDPDSTGYFLKVYDQKEVEGAKLIQSIPMRLTKTGADGTLELTATMDLEGGKTYGFKYTKATGASTVDWYGESGTMTSTNHTDWLFTTGTNNCGLTTTSAGDYTFHLHCVNYGTKSANTANATDVQGKMVMTVDYATLDGDYRVVYQDDSQLDLTDGVGVEPIASQSMRARANGQDTVTFYIRKDATNRSMKFQKFNAGAWEDVEGGTIALTNTTGQTFTVSKDTTYQIYLQQTADGTGIGATGMDYYSGSYYIRTDCVDEHKWDYKQTLDAHRMVESDYASHLTTDPFTHYYVHWVDGSKNVKFVVATKYSPTLTDTLITDDYANVAGGNLPSAGASVRFMYNKGTNAIKRAYLAGAQGGLLDPDYLKLTESSSSKMKNMSGSAITSITFTDLGNFAYQAEIKAQPGLTGKLTAEYNSQIQYFKGGPSTSETILGGTGSSWQHIIMTYDFKTNRLICAWTPGDTIDETMSINADVMIIRRGKNDAEQIVFKTNENKLTDVKYIYGVIQLDYSDLVGRMYSWDWWAYEHCMYYISFPFDVLVSDITGVGTIGQDWRIQRYNGALRAEKGWFEQDGVKTWWEDVHAGDTLHAYEGYSLLLARTRFNDSSNPIWENKTYGNSVYLFFPSLNATTGIIADGEVTFTVPAHECNIERPFLNPYGEYVSHKISDSHWNMMGMPLFENKTAFSIDAGPSYETEYGYSKTLQYLYAWNSAGNTLGIQLTLDKTWEFKTMYSYMVQYTGEVTFKGSTVNKIVAAKREEEKKNYYVNLELSKDEQFIGRTYIELRENAVDSFLLNEDVYMVQNGVNADIYTVAGGCAAAANVLPIANQIVPVGLSVKQAGTYVFSMPSDFDGEVILVDKYAQTRTNLAMEDYETALPTGEITDRFEVEININKVATAIDGTNGDGSLKDGNAHKFIENGMMYILQNGALYDAQGKRVK